MLNFERILLFHNSNVMLHRQNCVISRQKMSKPTAQHICPPPLKPHWKRWISIANARRESTQFWNIQPPSWNDAVCHERTQFVVNWRHALGSPGMWDVVFPFLLSSPRGPPFCRVRPNSARAVRLHAHSQRSCRSKYDKIKWKLSEWAPCMLCSMVEPLYTLILIIWRGFCYYCGRHTLWASSTIQLTISQLKMQCKTMTASSNPPTAVKIMNC